MRHPEYSENQKWWLVEGTNGSAVYEEHTFTMEEAIVEYPGVPLTEPTIIFGVGMRMVNTDTQAWEEEWEQVFPTLNDAKNYVRGRLGIHPDSGYMLEQ